MLKCYNVEMCLDVNACFLGILWFLILGTQDLLLEELLFYLLLFVFMLLVSHFVLNAVYWNDAT